MTAYKLIKLAAGSYDVAFNGVIIAGLVMSETPSRVRTWTAELLVDLPQGVVASVLPETASG